LGALSAHPIEDEIVNIEGEESISYKLRLYSRQNAKETTPIGRELEEVNLSSKFFDFISQNLAAI
jgi:hypothetical protein